MSWCGGDENFEETRLAQEVYARAQEYGDFLDKGMPITYDVPDKPGTVISGLVLDGRVLVRRTDFTANTAPVEIMVGVKKLKIPCKPGVCQLLSLD